MKPYIVHFHVLFAKTSGVCISKSYVFIQMGPPVSHFGSWVMHQCTHNLCCSNLFLSQISLVINFLSQFFISFLLSQCSSQLYLSQNSFVTNIFFKSSNTMFATYCCHIFYVEKSPQSCTLQYCILQLLGPTSLKKSSCPHPLVPCYNTPSTLLISNSIQSHPITSSSILSHLIPSNPL